MRLKDRNILMTRKVWKNSKIVLSSTLIFWILETLFFIIKDGFHLRAETKAEMICDNIVTLGFWLYGILYVLVITNVIQYLLSYDNE